MGSLQKTLVIATALSATVAGASGKPKSQIDMEHTLRIRLYNQATVPSETLKWATADATRIFANSGINVIWEQPAAETPEDRGTDMSSAPLPGREHWRSYIALRILPRTAASTLRGALGFSLPFAQTGAHVLLFYDRVEATARLQNVTPYVVLGYAMAHEIGHVLLRSPEHSAVGLMQARWNQATWRLATGGLLSFLPEQKQRIRIGLLKFTASRESPSPRDSGGLCW
ncbi:MAG: hypothetical protein JO270_21710 [Acidobacteriaceae bacterium]|nr:hypothetical protein [Acidobacteriaceae bacterium]